MTTLLTRQVSLKIIILLNNIRHWTLSTHLLTTWKNIWFLWMIKRHLIDSTGIISFFLWRSLVLVLILPFRRTLYRFPLAYVSTNFHYSKCFRPFCWTRQLSHLLLWSAAAWEMQGNYLPAILQILDDFWKIFSLWNILK